MVQACGSIQFSDNRRQIDAQAPFVCSPASAL
jgi:hypothetical protein